MPHEVVSYPYEEIAVLKGLSDEILKEFHGKEPEQFMADFINVLDNPAEYVREEGNYYTFDEMAEIN